MISFEKLFKIMADRGITRYRLGVQIGDQTLVYSLQKNKNKNVTTTTISKICAAFNCQPGDIMEYIPDDKDENDSQQQPF